MIFTILVVVALICELLAVAGWPNNVNLVALGLVFFFLALLIGGVGATHGGF